jgi:predicted rRNA methylase YqxC with S4 and FtsJ domains
MVAHAVDSTGGFTQVLCALKALLEHDVGLNVVHDHLEAAQA